VLHYQPQVSGDRVCGVEALVRWRRSPEELIAPEDFISIAEETGIIAPLGSWVLREACRQLVAWRRAGLCDADLTMAVNVSPLQLGTPDLIAALREVLEEFPIDPARLCLEVTESAVVGDSAATAQELENLKELGIQLAVDDFGTGFASLDHLNRFPLDVLKIDRRFIRGVSHDPQSKALVTALVRVAQALDLSPVAEGVELRSQAAELDGLGCGIMQGFLFSRPRPEDEVGPLLALDPGSQAGPTQPLDGSAPAHPVRVFLCDDVDELRELTRLQLANHPDIVVVGEAGDGKALIERVAAARPDVILLDLSMPRMDGLEAIVALRQHFPTARIVIFSGFEARSLRARALDLGAHDYIEKRRPAAEIVAAIRAAGSACREELVLAAGAAP
jgi:EAL domain-containing protein (putative c-di-GMP-specific phosphodiesterase class I)/CheY-like chemotaxis protein